MQLHVSRKSIKEVSDLRTRIDLQPQDGAISEILLSNGDSSLLSQVLSKAETEQDKGKQGRGRTTTGHTIGDWSSKYVK